MTIGAPHRLSQESTLPQRLRAPPPEPRGVPTFPADG
jgi:hypothetical protein